MEPVDTDTGIRYYPLGGYRYHLGTSSSKEVKERGCFTSIGC